MPAVHGHILSPGSLAATACPAATDAPPDHWSAVVGVPAFPEVPLSLVVLADPSFVAVQDLMSGLDFAFPTAATIGELGVLAAFGGWELRI